MCMSGELGGGGGGEGSREGGTTTTKKFRIIIGWKGKENIK